MPLGPREGPVILKWYQISALLASPSVSLPQYWWLNNYVAIWKKRGKERVKFQLSRIHIRTGCCTYWDEIVAMAGQRTPGSIRGIGRVKETLQVSTQEQGKATTHPRRLRGLEQNKQLVYCNFSLWAPNVRLLLETTSPKWSIIFIFYFILFFSFIFISWRLITLHYCSSFLSYIDMKQPWIYMYSPSQSPLLPSSPPDPSGSSQCTSPEHLSHTPNLGRWSVSPQIIYMFWCCSLETSHSCLLPQSPK